jgi:flagellar biosynthetic protein FliR
VSLALIITWMYVFARFSGLFLTLPVLSMVGIPTQVRVVAGALLAALVAPMVMLAPPPESLGLLALAMGTEAMLGLTAGALVATMFSALNVAFEIVSLQIGFAMASMFDPLNKTTGNVLGTLATWLGGLVFVTADLHLAAFEVAAQSFAVIPAGGAHWPWHDGAILADAVGRSIALGVQIAGPAVILSLLINGFVAILARIAQRMNVFFALGTALTASLGIMLLFHALPWMLSAHLTAMEGVMHAFARLLGM